MIKKENILESARKVLTEQGIDKLSLRKIAAETGCAAPSIYYYFKNKQEIVGALWEEITPLLEQQLAASSDLSKAYSEFWLSRPDDFRLFITNADFFSAVAATEAYTRVKTIMGDAFHGLNGALMEKIYLSA